MLFNSNRLTVRGLGIQSVPPDCEHRLMVYLSPCVFSLPDLWLVLSALSKWHTPSLSISKSAQYRKAERDFVALNREGVKSGLVTAKELHQFRATHDIRRPVVSKTYKSAPVQIPQDITFGLPTR